MRQHTPDLRKAQYVRKAQQVTDLKGKLGRASASVLIEYRGMTVAETTELRSRLRKIDAEMEVAKNTLIKRAVQGSSVSALEPHLEGPTAVVFAFSDALAAVKTVNDYMRESRHLLMKAGVVEGRSYDSDQLVAIAKMPPRDQIYSALVGALQAPAANLVGMLQAPMAQLVFTLQAVAEKGQAA